MWTEFVLPTLGVLGVGSLLAIFLRYWLAKRARAYAEKCDVHPEFLAAWKAREEQPEAYARSRSRVELFGSAKVMWRVRGIEQAASFSYEDMANTYPLLIDAMREDLGREPSEEL